MSGKITHFYASGNTAHGFISKFDSSLQGLDRVFVLRGAPATGKSGIIRGIGESLAIERDVWFIHCPTDNGSLDGIVIPGLKTGIVDGTAPRTIQPDLAEERLRFIDLDDACNTDLLGANKTAIESLNNAISEAYGRAYSGFAEALRIHDEWEKIYIASINFEAADTLTSDIMHMLYGDRKLEKQSRVDHRFLGAATPQGAVDFVPNLTDGLKRYFIKGRAGSGKSTLLKKIGAVGAERGFDVETYHCGFDPNSLDMIIVRELGFAIFDSTAPHEYFPDRPADEIIDMYEHCIHPGTDEAHASEIADIKKRYSAKMKQSIEQLAHAKSRRDELKRLYVPTVDYRIVDRIRESILQEITGQAAQRSH